MELHYLTLKRQSEFLSAHLAGADILDSYTQKKNEHTLLFRTVSQNQLELILSTDPVLPFILLRPAQKRARLSTRVIPELIDKKIVKIEIAERDRVISFIFTHADQVFKCQFFRHNSNFFLIDSDNMIQSAFKHNKKQQGKIYQSPANDLLDPMKNSQKEILEKLNQFPDVLFSQFLRKNIFYISPLILQEISIRSQLKLDIPVRDLKRSQLDLTFHHLREFIAACESDSPRIYFADEYPLSFSLTNLKIYQKASCQIFGDINEALEHFIFKRLRYDRKQKQAERISLLINKKLDQLNGWINHLSQLPDEKIQRINLQKQGELILAQMHQIPAGVSTTEVTDLFDREQKKITIKLDPALSPRKNAELYFQKAKEVSEKMRKNRENLKRLQQKQKQLHNYQELLQNNPMDKILNQIEKKLIELRVMQTDDERMQEIYHPYRQYFYENWEIWVGKNAKDNDQMTFHLAHKEDFWLHAQGVGGSHVIIRKSQRKQDPPKSVLEYAARLAAGFSQARSSSYVPVMFTRVKYVRKPRGSDAGAVIPERTKTIFVEPLEK
jgi:predicted ribosome quality control (RQC) complex YloA/Tae2 family protein